ncbi:GNAT family N-acetyltransferase [Aquimarina rhabdastrellae]
MIKNLSHTPLSTIVASIAEAFTGYFVKMPEDISFWEQKFKGAQVDFNYSYGYFDNGELIAFIIHGIEEFRGLQTAYNAGTGVVPSYRGQRLIDRLYAHAIPELKAHGISQILLEVIQENHAAIKTYKRIGFSIQRNLLCYQGSLQFPVKDVRLHKCTLADITNTPLYYTWEHTSTAITRLSSIYETYQVFDKDTLIGYFSIKPESGYLAQFESYVEDLSFLYSGIYLISKTIKCNNVDDSRTKHISFFKTYGLSNPINQYEMLFKI